ncbi:MFS transporter [Methylobacterium nodulans]|uniref:Major facilitator superfamily MFS_1 n=1 Tax=Methylobacterium nodulans (strain LMG 21967 / CNCM I-2342 / ORS 2060) TaxID=460265 RepID=B8IF72_METNO|nr:MFS transporter [Methylobacterium nodulans]ACL55783.1 major facilitator superfamily MFS_1 [Methylobacterium nodulans ORS 2060]
MSPDRLSRRTLLFVNVAHALDHFVLLIYPTAVIAIAASTGLGYASLIGLATGSFVAFGLCSLPVGWLADRFGRRTMLAVFFVGYGLSCLGVASASSPIGFAIWLLLLGMASAIYHPIGSTMLVTHARRLGRDLGINGVWGNLGAASASGATALITAALGWRAAFIIPGLVCLVAGCAFMAMVPVDGDGQARKTKGPAVIPVAHPFALLGVFAVAIVAGGMTFNVTTIALPKVIDEQLGLDLPLALTGSLATVVFVFGALMQLLMGRLVDRLALPTIFVGLAVLQPLGLGLASVSSGVPLLIGLVLVVAAIYGQVVVNDAMVARYVPAHHRAKAYSVRYFLGFTVSGLAVPLIALLHEAGGFGLVLAAAGGFGAVIFAAAVAFYTIAQRTAPRSAAPAE